MNPTAPNPYLEDILEDRATVFKPGAGEVLKMVHPVPGRGGL